MCANLVVAQTPRNGRQATIEQFLGKIVHLQAARSNTDERTRPHERACRTRFFELTPFCCCSGCNTRRRRRTNQTQIELRRRRRRPVFALLCLATVAAAKWDRFAGHNLAKGAANLHWRQRQRRHANPTSNYPLDLRAACVAKQAAAHLFAKRCGQNNRSARHRRIRENLATLLIMLLLCWCPHCLSCASARGAHTSRRRRLVSRAARNDDAIAQLGAQIKAAHEPLQGPVEGNLLSSAKRDRICRAPPKVAQIN